LYKVPAEKLFLDLDAACSFLNISRSSIYYLMLFYDDRKASCYVYRDRKSGIYKFKDFGDSGFRGDCFYFVGKIFNLVCDDHKDFVRILEIIDHELGLNLAGTKTITARIIRDNNGGVIRASQLPSIHDGFETALNKQPIQTKPATSTLKSLRPLRSPFSPSMMSPSALQAT